MFTACSKMRACAAHAKSAAAIFRDGLDRRKHEAAVDRVTSLSSVKIENPTLWFF